MKGFTRQFSAWHSFVTLCALNLCWGMLDGAFKVALRSTLHSYTVVTMWSVAVLFCAFAFYLLWELWTEGVLFIEKIKAFRARKRMKH